MIVILSFFTFLVPSLAQADALENAERLIPNFRQVSPGVYRGGNPMSSLDDKAGLDALADLGVDLVINLQGADEDGSSMGWVVKQFQTGESAEAIREEERYLKKKGIDFVNLPFSSHEAVGAREARNIEKAVKLLAKASGSRRIFVHCQHGADRTGLVIALHRLRNRGYTVKQAYDEWVQLGHDIGSWALTGKLDSYFFLVAEEFPVGL